MSNQEAIDHAVSACRGWKPRTIRALTFRPLTMSAPITASLPTSSWR